MAELLTSEEIQLRVHQLTDESLECTEKIFLLASECQDTGIKVITMLDKQGEQLNHVEENIDQIKRDVKEARKSLTELSKCCGLSVCPFKSKKKAELSKSHKTTWDDERENLNHHVVSKQPQCVIDLKRQEFLGETSGGHEAQKANDARDYKIEENLIQVGNILGNLKDIALEMSSVIDAQNKQIDWINKKAKTNKCLIEQADRKARRLTTKQPHA